MTTRPISSAALIATASVAGLWQGFASRLLAAARTVGTRRCLLEMDARMLKDIGITHAEAIEEARRMPWDIGHYRGRR
jgi:uncharacterized protein YjiS (DUF1127 family)